MTNSKGDWVFPRHLLFKEQFYELRGKRRPWRLVKIKGPKLYFAEIQIDKAGFHYTGKFLMLPNARGVVSFWRVMEDEKRDGD